MQIPPKAPSWNSLQVEEAFRDAGAEVTRQSGLRVVVDGEMWFETRSPRTERQAVDICRDKVASAKALGAAGVPAPEAVASSPQQAQKVVAQLGWPVAVKPLVGSRGRAVTTDIRSRGLLLWAVHQASRRGREKVVVERSVEGVHWRVLVFGRAVSCIESRPWLLTGDGRAAIDRLVAVENRRREQLPRAFPLTIDETMVRVLAEQKLSPMSVLARGRTARVAWSLNARQGAIPVEHGSGAPARVIRSAEGAVAAIGGLYHGAVDLVDDGETAWVVDVNSNPGLGSHIHPHEGEPQPVMDALVATHRAVR